MPVTFRDYYAVLGVPRTATDDEIKKAFRKLARLHHPDVAKDKKSAEEKFKEINEAHEVLSDPVKRRKFDELGANWDENGRAPSPGPAGRGAPRGHGPQAREFHFTGTGFSDFFEQHFGGGDRFGFQTEDEDSPAGRRRPGRRGGDVEGEILVTLDEAMHGTVRPISLQMIDPHTGAAEKYSFQVRIPAGATEGRRIRVPGKGEPGLGDAPAGDLYLRVRHAAHPDFQARDADLYHDVDLAPWDAVLGTTVVTPSFEGPIKVRVPSGTKDGADLRVRGHGLPKDRGGERGDLHVVVHVQLPTKLTDPEKALWEELRRTSTFDPSDPV